MLTLVSMLAGLALCILLPIVMRKVAGGWVNPKFKGTREEFVAKCRRLLTWLIWLGLVIGVVSIAAAWAPGDTLLRIDRLASGAIFVALAIVSFMSRRHLDASAGHATLAQRDGG
jgi:hypothetical protein